VHPSFLSVHVLLTAHQQFCKPGQWRLLQHSKWYCWQLVLALLCMPQL
jgi:hypothetical protein